jgi:hypothetical protein
MIVPTAIVGTWTKSAGRTDDRAEVCSRMTGKQEVIQLDVNRLSVEVLMT